MFLLLIACEVRSPPPRPVQGAGSKEASGEKNLTNSSMKTTSFEIVDPTMLRTQGFELSSESLSFELVGHPP